MLESSKSRIPRDVFLSHVDEQSAFPNDFPRFDGSLGYIVHIWYLVLKKP